MQVCFRDNLGSADARKFGLDFRECVRGAERRVNDELGERLVKAGIAVVTSPAAIDTAAAPPDVTTAAAAADGNQKPEARKPKAENDKPKK